MSSPSTQLWIFVKRQILRDTRGRKCASIQQKRDMFHAPPDSETYTTELTCNVFHTPECYSVIDSFLWIALVSLRRIADNEQDSGHTGFFQGGSIRGLKLKPCSDCVNNRERESSHAQFHKCVNQSVKWCMVDTLGTHPLPTATEGRMMDLSMAWVLDLWWRYLCFNSHTSALSALYSRYHCATGENGLALQARQQFMRTCSDGRKRSPKC